MIINIVLKLVTFDISNIGNELWMNIKTRWNIYLRFILGYKGFSQNYGQTVSKAELSILHNSFNWFSHVRPQNYYQSTLFEKVSM